MGNLENIIMWSAAITISASVAAVIVTDIIKGYKLHRKMNGLNNEFSKKIRKLNEAAYELDRTASLLY